VSWANGSNAVLSGHDYTLDAMNRRTAALRQDGSKWNYGYNLRGEVTSAAKADYASVPEPGKQYGFAFDGLGNRSSSTLSSLADNEVLRSTGYTPNAVNQYEAINHPSPGWLVLRGRVNAQSSVTIDGNAPTLLSGGRWHHEQSVDNSAGAVRRVAEVTATRPDGGTNNAAVTARHKGALFIPPPLEVVTHDEDGNQTSNAHWSYTWDGENRMIAAEESLAILLQPPGSGPVKRQRIECAYDAQGRRIYKRVLTAEGMSTTFALKQSVVFLYDGWNMIAEIDTTTSARLIRSYEWGTDLSGTMDGAGGVGGLLVERLHSGTTSTTVNNSQPSSTTAYAPCYDGNGNITELVNLATNTLSARYEYGAFGETISVDGDAIADANPIRFSTKYLDVETGFYNYGFRLYEAPNARWLSKDPIGERGGINLYGMVGNDPVNRVDVLGHETFYPTPLELAHAAGINAYLKEKEIFDAEKKKGNSLSMRERGGRLCCRAGVGYYATEARGYQNAIALASTPKCKAGDTQMGWWHLHHGGVLGQGATGPSPEDKNFPATRGSGLPLTTTRLVGEVYETTVISGDGELLEKPKITSPEKDGVPKSPIPSTPQPK
jgi:RHS repeat-associated protein